MERTRPRGKVIGIDLIPAQPPRGVATFQGDFLSPTVQALVKDFITRTASPSRPGTTESNPSDANDDTIAIEQPSYIDRERHMSDAAEQASGLALVDVSVTRHSHVTKQDGGKSMKLRDRRALLMPDQVVLSDMSEPWHQTSGYTANTLSNPYHRLMNTSGNAFRDHAGSMVSPLLVLC